MVSADNSPARAALFARFDALGIAHTTYEHGPVFTVKEGAHLKAHWPGGHSKNLFLKDKKGRLVLISAKDQTKVPLKRLHHHLDVGRLSFGSAALMEEVLGVSPGAVTIFALMNEAAKQLSHIILDAALMACDPVHFHPLENTATTAISPQDLMRFIADCGFEPRIMDFSVLPGLPPRA